MGLARIFPGVTGLGQMIIRQLGDVGGPPASRVDTELDTIIAWAKDAVREVGRDTSVVGNVGLGLDNLHSFSLDTPNRLNTNGDWVRVSQGGTFAANANTKRLVFSFGGVGVEDTGLIDLQGLGWKSIAEYVRISSTTARANFMAIIGHIQFNAAGTFVSGVGCRLITRNQLLTGLSDLGANAQTILVQGETNAAVNDNVQQNLTIVELRQQ